MRQQRITLAVGRSLSRKQSRVPFPPVSATAIFALITTAGALFVLGGVAISRSAGRWRRAARARGVVERVEMGPGVSTAPHIDTTPGYYAWVRYRTADGRDVHGRTQFASNPPPGRPGHEVTVLYHPDRPEVIRLDTVMGRGGCVAVPIYLLGGALLLVGIIGLRVG